MSGPSQSTTQPKFKTDLPEERKVMKPLKSFSIQRLRNLALLFVAALYLAMPSIAAAADYIVVGRVYSAATLVEGEAVPNNPLSAVAPDQVIGAGLVANVPRNLVRVRVLQASDGTELADFITRRDGGYFASFSAPAGGVTVRFVVDELATSQQLLDSEPQTLNDPVNVRYLLIEEVSTEIADDREFATAVAPATTTGIFTRVGKIELATEVGGVTTHLIDPITGLANVPASVSSDLAIPQYEDAPFGGNLFLFGAFSQSLYSIPNLCYKIRIYEDPSDHSTWTYMDDNLVKTRYTVNFATGTVNTDRVTLGPKTVGAVADCYELTPLSSGNVFWSYPDLLALWRTAGLNGDFEVEIELFGPVPAGFALIPDFSDITFMLDNVAPVALIQPLAPGDFDTPRVYTPGPLPPSADLQPALLGNFPVDYGGTADPTCAIFDVQTAGNFVAFNLTASHPNPALPTPALRYWNFLFQRNDGNNAVVMGKRYDGSTNTMVDHPGALVSSAQSSPGGFTNQFLYLDSAHLQPGGTPVSSCAYRFLIQAATRTTDGYHYLRYRQDQDLHFVLKNAVP